MAVPATEAKKGQVLKLDEKYYLVIDHKLITPGNKRGFIQFKLKDLTAGGVQQKKIGSDDGVEIVFLDRQACEYLYQDGPNHVFMNLESYEQYQIPGEDLEGVLPFMAHNQEVTVTFLEGKAVSVDLPASVELEVTEAPPAVRGNTATNVTKEATLETGAKVNVPHFIEAGEKIKIDTRTGSFMSRA